MTVDLNKIDLVIDKLEILTNNKDIVVLLRGDLASGKTTLVKNFARAKNIKDDVTSPTFSIQVVYSNNIYHYDLYNKSLDEFISLGILEEFEKKGIHFVEWGDENLEKILNDYGFEVLVIDIEKKDDKREYHFKY